MNYVLDANKDNPLGLWMLDDTTPFQDYSGYNRSGTAAGTVKTSIALADGAVYSSIFHKNAIATFDSPVFVQGRENDDFSISANVLPIVRTEGYKAQTYQENLFVNPSLEINGNNWASRWYGAGGGNGTNVLTAAAAKVGGYGYRKTWTVAPSNSQDTGFEINVFGLTPGKAYSFGMYLRASVAQAYTPWVQFYRADNSAILTSNRVADSAQTPANTWKLSKIENQVVPAETAYAKFITGPFFGTITNWAPGNTLDADAAMVNEGPVLNDYFDGTLPGYEWTGTAYASTSRTRSDVSVTNLIHNPHIDGPTATSPIRRNIAWSDSGLPFNLSGATLTTGVTADGSTGWTRVTTAGVAGSVRKNIALASLQSNRIYTAAWEVYNDTAAAVSVTADWCDFMGTTVIVNPGQRTVIYASGSRVYDATYRFTDLNLSTLNTSILFKEISVELATGYLPYFDGTQTAATHNLAKFAPVVGVRPGFASGVDCITDGGTLSGRYHDMPSDGSNPSYVTVDLGSLKKIDTIKVWHYYNDARIYNGTKTEVSEDGTTWFTVFNSATSGTYTETSAGRTTTFAPRYVRYIRDHLAGSNANSSNHWVEIEAFYATGEFTYGWAGAAWQAEARQNASSPGQWSHSVGGSQGSQFKMTEDGVTFVRFFTPAKQQTSMWRLIFANLYARLIAPGDNITIEFRVRAGGEYIGMTNFGGTILKGDGLLGVGLSFAGTTLTSQWQTVRKSIVATTEPDPAAGWYAPLPNTATTSDSWVDVEYAFVTVNSPNTPYFSGDSPGGEWFGIPYSNPSMLLTSEGEQEILSHLGNADGITIDGTKVSFSTKYLTTGTARAEHDLQTLRAFTAVGVHTPEKNSLYIDGELAAEVDITAEQKADKFIPTDGKLYSGKTPSSRTVSVNGVSVYSQALSAEAIKRQFEVSRNSVGVTASNLYGGISIPLDKTVFPRRTEKVWDSRTAWEGGNLRNLVIEDDALVPQIIDNTSVSGEWLASCDLYEAGAATPIKSINLSWNGEGVVVEASVNGTTWETVSRGRSLTSTPVNFDPTQKELLIRLSFPGGIVEDESYIEDLTVNVFRESSVPAPDNRTVTFTYPVDIGNPRSIGELSDDWGVRINTGGNVVISPGDTAPKTMEVWYKARTGDLVTGFPAASYYTNGQPGVNVATGNWQVMHFVNTSTVTSNITIQGDIQLGRVVLYPNELTATQISELYKSYVGVPSSRVGDNSVIAVAESPEAAKIYAHDWSIESAG